MKKNSIKKNFLMNCILTASTFLIPLITTPYVTRILQPKGIGIVTYAQSTANIFLLFAMLGIPTYGIKVVSQHRDSREELSQRVFEIFIINIIMCLLTIIVYCLYMHNLEHEEKSIYMIFGVMLLSNPIGVEWLYKGLEKYTYITIRTLVFKFIALMGIFLFVKNEEDVLTYAFFIVFAFVASNIFNFISLHKYVMRVQIEFKKIIVHVKPIFIFFAMSIATTVYTNLDNIMLGKLCNATEVGYYSIVVKMRSLLLSIVTSLGAVLLPRMSYYIKNGLNSEFYQVSKKVMHFVFLISIPLLCFFTLMADVCIYIFAGEAFLPAVKAFRVILPTIVFVGMSNLIGIQMFVPMNKEKIALKSVVFGAIVDFGLNLFFIPLFGAVGAALATTFAEIIVLLVQIIALETKTLQEIMRLHWGDFLLSNLISIIAVIIVKKIVADIYVSFIVGGMVYFIIYFLVLLVLKDEMVVYVDYFIKSKFKQRKRL